MARKLLQRRNILQVRAELSSLELCRAQLEILYQKKLLELFAWVYCSRNFRKAIKKNTPKGVRKKYRKVAWNVSRERLFVVVGDLGGCLCNLRETLGFSLCGLFEYSCVDILPQITQITQTNAASCIISQRKTDWSLCGFEVWGFGLRKSARDLLFFFGDWLSTLMCLFSRRWRRSRRGIQLSCIISQRKTGCLRLRLFCCLLFVVCCLSA